jgi:hypothetical protein
LLDDFGGRVNVARVFTSSSATSSAGGVLGAASRDPPVTDFVERVVAVAASYSGSALGAPSYPTGEPSSVTISQSRQTITLSINAGSQSYTYTFSGTEGGTVSTGPLAGLTAFNATNPDGSSDELIYDTSLQYSHYGIWEHDDNAAQSSGQIGGFASGSITPPGGMPVTGTATYSGHALGALSTGSQSYALVGTSVMTANFGRGTIVGTMALNATPDGGATTGFWNDVSLSAAITDSGFLGTVSAPASTAVIAQTPAMTGTTTGQFYGPNGNEIGGIWTLNGVGASALGAFGGH